jgi:tetratricopeptide (TPR) repeat protein
LRGSSQGLNSVQGTSPAVKNADAGGGGLRHAVLAAAGATKKEIRRCGVRLGAPGIVSVAAGMLLALSSVTGCKYSAQKTLEQAAAARDAGNYEEAARLYERYLQSDPGGSDSLDARLRLADLYNLNLHRYEQALAEYTEVLNRSPGDPVALAARERMADVLSDLGRSFDAIAEYEKLNPTDETQRRRIRLRIADLYFDQKNFSQALAEYTKVSDGVDYDELGEQAYLREASIYQLERRQYQQALPIYQKIASSTSDQKVGRRAAFCIADCYAALSEYEKAIKTLREVKDPAEQSFVASRITELEQQSKEAARGTPLLRH